MKFPEIKEKRDYSFKQIFNCDSTSTLIDFVNDIEKSDLEAKDIFKHHFNMTYEPKPITIYINSYGGEVYPTLGLYDILMKCSTPVHTYGTGIASSCGFLTLLAGHKRFGYKNTSYLCHTIASCNWGSLQDLEEGAKETQRLHKIITDIVTSRTTITKQRLLEIKERKFDWWINSKEALKYKIINEIL